MPIQEEMAIRIKVGKGQADRAVKGLTGSFKGLKGGIGGVLSKLGGLRGLLVGGALVLGIRSLTKEVVAFEAGLGKVATLVDDVDQVFGEFAHEIEGISIEFGQTTETLSQGLFDIISATIDAADAMEVLEASTKLAVGGVTSTGVATSAVITAFQTFSEELDGASDASDLLFAIQKRGRLTVEDVARTFGIVASTAATAGVTVEDLGAAFAAISRAGIGAEKTVTSLNRLIGVFAKVQSPEAIAIAKEFGVELNNSSIAGGKFITTLLKMKDATAEQRAILFRQERARRAFNILMTKSGELLEDVASITDRAGGTQRALNIQMGLASVKFKQFKAVIAALKVQLGAALLPALTDVADRTREWMKSVEGKQAIDDFAAAVSALVPIVQGTADFIGEIAQGMIIMADAAKVVVGLQTTAEKRLTEIRAETLELKIRLALTQKVLRLQAEADARRGELPSIPELPAEVVDPRVSEAARRREQELQGMLSSMDRFDDSLDDALERAGVMTDSRMKAIAQDVRDTFETLEGSTRLTGSNLAEAWSNMREEIVDNIDIMDEEMKEWVDNMDTRFPEIVDKAQEDFVFLEELTRETARTMSNSFEDLFFRVMKNDFEDMGDFAMSFLESIQRSISSIFAQQFATSLVGASGKGGALGGFFKFLGFQHGGVVNQPTVLGVAGEGGRSEAVLPLKRDLSGDLGVSSVGGGRGTGAEREQPIVVVNMISPTAMVSAGLSDPKVKNVFINDISGDILRKGIVFKTLRRGF
jgi:TP901 family phage tail tape measure protein